MIGSIHIERSLPAARSASRIVEDMRTALVAAGFRITKISSDEVVARSNGLSSGDQNPIRGAGTLTLRLTADRALMTADMVGLRGFAMFCALFPPAAMALSLAKDPSHSVTVLCLALGWLGASPLGIRWLRVRTRRSLENLLDGLLVG